MEKLNGEKEISRIVPITIGVVLITVGVFFLVGKITYSPKKLTN